jgi:single-strand DNA-binding protein
MNQCVLVGRIKEQPQVSTTPKGHQIAKLVMEVDHNFRNEDGHLDTDLFQVTLWRGIAEDCAQLCHVGDWISVRGRLEGSTYEKNGGIRYSAGIVAEKVEFLSLRIAATS